MEQFPKWVFAKDLPPVLVKTAEGQAALGEGYYENPTLTDEAPAAHAPLSPTETVLAATPIVEYPMYLFRADDTSQRVENADGREALGPGWYESVGEAQAAEKPAARMVRETAAEAATSANVASGNEPSTPAAQAAPPVDVKAAKAAKAAAKAAKK